MPEQSMGAANVLLVDGQPFRLTLNAVNVFDGSSDEWLPVAQQDWGEWRGERHPSKPDLIILHRQDGAQTAVESQWLEPVDA